MKDSVYWIWLQRSIGFGSNKISKILSNVSSIEDFYHSGLNYWNSLSIFTERELFYLSKSLEDSKRICEKCDRLGYKIISCVSDKFPKMLREIANPPCVLYVNGQLSALLNKCVSIVGSRDATVYGVQMASEISEDLAKAGITVVSGCAFGVDSASHRGAVLAKGTTIGVVACGLDYPYLVRNLALREQISNFGALISEFPPGYPVQRFNFPIRNRIISGMSPCTVVIEAGARSGAVVTATIAAEQGRDVFVIPVRFESPLSAGVNSLIEDGAKVVTCADDIIKLSFSNDFCNFQKKKDNPQKNIPEKFMPILKFIKNKSIHINDLKFLTKMPMNKLSVYLAKMELLGLVEQLPGKFYRINIEK